MSKPLPNFEYPRTIEGILHVDPDQTDTTKFGLYAIGTTKLFYPGTRYRRGDSAYRYGYATAAVKSGYGAFNGGTYSGVTGGNVTERAIGDDTVDILLDATTGGATWFGTANQMVGGFYSQPDATCSQFRMIIGHDRGDNADTIWLNLDGPITRTMVATSFTEICQNPYSQLKIAGGGWASVMGVPVTNIAASSYGWLQTWGPTWLTPGLPVADTINWREVVFVGDGSIRSYEDATGETGYQRAGFVIDCTSGDNPPFVFLQINP